VSSTLSIASSTRQARAPSQIRTTGSPLQLPRPSQPQATTCATPLRQLTTRSTRKSQSRRDPPPGVTQGSLTILLMTPLSP